MNTKFIIRDRKYFDYDSSCEHLTWGPKFTSVDNDVFIAEQALAEILLATNYFE